MLTRAGWSWRTSTPAVFKLHRAPFCRTSTYLNLSEHSKHPATPPTHHHHRRPLSVRPGTDNPGIVPYWRSPPTSPSCALSDPSPRQGSVRRRWLLQVASSDFSCSVIQRHRTRTDQPPPAKASRPHQLQYFTPSVHPSVVHLQLVARIPAGDYGPSTADLALERLTRLPTLRPSKPNSRQDVDHQRSSVQRAGPVH